VLSPEIRWILGCLRSLDGSDPPPSPGPLNWDLLLATAEAEGLAAPLGFALRARAPAAMPGAVRARLSRQLGEETARHLILRRELGRVLRAFVRDEIPVIPLKGLVLAETLYADPVLRPSSDLDLLVRPEAVVAVDELLQRLGYRRLADDHSWSFDLAYDRATLYTGPGGVHVDLHWSLLSDPRYVWNDAESLQIWDRATKIQVAGESALGLCPEDLVLYLAIHLAVHHGLAGLLWYWDLALILGRWRGQLDWTALLERASRWRVRRAVGFALMGCETFFEIGAPAQVATRLRPRGLRAAALHWLVRRGEADHLARLEHLIALLLVERGRDLVAPLARVVCPSPAWVRARYGADGSSLLEAYVAHYRRLAAVGRRLNEGLASRPR
jgi:hypothetical protein